VRGGKLMKKYNFKITFENDDIEAWEIKGLVEENVGKKIFPLLESGRLYDLTISIAELKDMQEE
jgi:hypothetical protein